MRTLRTPDERFEGLADFPFAPHYAEIDDLDGGSLRVHYLDEGPAEAAPVLLLHGEPSWSYLYRHIVGPVAAAGHRVIVPDLVGFGRSDKPADQSEYTYGRHVAWTGQLLIDHLDLRHITFFGQDWGGLIGLRVLASAPERFAGVVVSNTGLPDGLHPPSKAFLAWQHFSRTSPTFHIGRIVDGGCVRALSEVEIAAYDAPFPGDEYLAGARILPSLVPTSGDDPAAADNQAAWRVLEGFDRPFLCAFSDRDPVTAGADRPFRQRVPGAANQAHTTIEGGGHFVQEDCPAAVVASILAVIAGEKVVG